MNFANWVKVTKFKKVYGTEHSDHQRSCDLIGWNLKPIALNAYNLKYLEQ